MSTQQRAAVLDLTDDELAGEFERRGGLGGDLELANAEFDVLVPQSGCHGVEPASIGEVAERHAARGEVADGGFSDVDVPEEADLRHILDGDRLDLLTLLLDDHAVTAFAEGETVVLEVERESVVPSGEQATDGGRGMMVYG